MYGLRIIEETKLERGKERKREFLLAACVVEIVRYAKRRSLPNREVQSARSCVPSRAFCRTPYNVQGMAEPVSSVP